MSAILAIFLWFSAAGLTARQLHRWEVPEPVEMPLPLLMVCGWVLWPGFLIWGIRVRLGIESQP